MLIKQRQTYYRFLYTIRMTTTVLILSGRQEKEEKKLSYFRYGFTEDGKRKEIRSHEES